jgi:hypothetical protein
MLHSKNKALQIQKKNVCGEKFLERDNPVERRFLWWENPCGERIPLVTQCIASPQILEHLKI